jgi:hypothetical protein
MVNKELKHREQFASEKLVELFPGTLGYALETIGRGLGDPARMGVLGLSVVEKTLETFRNALGRREIEISTYPGVDGVYRGLEYPVKQLRDYLNRRPSDIASDDETRIFLYYVSDKLDDLRAMAEEIDAEYASPAE